MRRQGYRLRLLLSDRKDGITMRAFGEHPQPSFP